MTVRFVAEEARGAVHGRHGDGLRLDPLGRIRRQDDGGRRRPTSIDREPIGTGPFQFVSYQKDAVIRYKAFDQHWGGRPKIDNLVYAITTDASVRYAKLKTGECHVMAFPKPADVALMKNDPSDQPACSSRA